MPASYTHYRFGCDVLAALPEDLQAKLAPHRSLFDIGLHGPDIFFYTNPLMKNSVSRLGRAMHRHPGQTAFHRFAALYDGTDESFAWLAGFLCHFALDSICHGYVQQMTALGMSHARLETQLDRSFLLEDGKDPVTTDLVSHIQPTHQNTRVIARFFPQLNEQTVRKSLEQMLFYHHLLMAPNAPKRQLLGAAFRVLDAEDTFGAMVMTRDEVPACKQMVRRLRLLYAEAVPLAVALIGRFPDLTHPQYRYDFNGTLHGSGPQRSTT